MRLEDEGMMEKEKPKIDNQECLSISNHKAKSPGPTLEREKIKKEMEGKRKKPVEMSHGLLLLQKEAQTLLRMIKLAPTVMSSRACTQDCRRSVHWAVPAGGTANNTGIPQIL